MSFQYRQKLFDLGKIYKISEIKNYLIRNKRLTTAQLELILLKNRVPLPFSDKNLPKSLYSFKLKEKIFTNLFLTVAIFVFVFSIIVSRPYIKSVVSKVKLTYVSSEYDSNYQLKKDIIQDDLKSAEKSFSLQSKKNKNKIKVPKSNFFSLNTMTTMNLFEDLDYDLNNVRSNKKIKPIYLTQLPRDLKDIESVKVKKDIFIKIILPLIVAENDNILKDRRIFFKILNKSNNSMGEKIWLNRKFKEYKIKDKDTSELKKRMDVIPVSIAVAQAAKESGWGTSRFALEGNAMFGQWTWGGEGIVPLDKNKSQSHKILKFPILRASVKAYKNNLNTHNGYKEFRTKRSELRNNNKPIKGLDLIHLLDRYAETGAEYTLVLEKIINQNSLAEFDDISLLQAENKKEFNL
ncbi:MAG: Bax protein [Pelagibacterales bacterium]|nr:Bax protein [Pelagibacterales bacterium]